MDLCLNKEANLLSMAIEDEDSYPDEIDIDSNCYRHNS